MFNEKNRKWMKLYKIYTIVMFWVYAAATLAMTICGWADVLYWTEPFLDGLICLVGGSIVTGVHLIGNMLILQFLGNVQTIREKLEGADAAQEESFVEPVGTPYEKLKALGQMREQGSISQEDFLKLKAKYLAEL